MYSLYLYFLGLSFRNVSRAIELFIQRSHVAVWKWVQKFDSKQIYQCKKVTAFLIDETMIQIGNTKTRLWVTVELVLIVVLGVYISRHRNMLVTAEQFLDSLIEKYGRHIYSDGDRSWVS
jgi:putative transposase